MFSELGLLSMYRWSLETIFIGNTLSTIGTSILFLIVAKYTFKNGAVWMKFRLSGMGKAMR